MISKDIIEFMNNIKISEKFPLVIEPKENPSLEVLQQENAFFKEKLLEHGALLFRNFPIQDADDFGLFLKAFNTGSSMDYIGGDSPRKKIREGIYTSTEAPPSIKIPLHNELSFTKNFPEHIYFYCDIAPKEKGETIIADARKVYASIDKGVKERFTEKKLTYVSSFPGKKRPLSFMSKYHRSWMEVFETEDKEEIERKCRENEFSYQWLKNDWLQVSQTRPAVYKHPITKEDVWFNQAHLFDFNPKFLGWFRYLATKVIYFQDYQLLHRVTFADGSEIPREDLYHILDVLDQNTVYFPWKKGDVLVLDNVLSMHGRATFEGPRRVLAAMTNHA